MDAKSIDITAVIFERNSSLKDLSIRQTSKPINEHSKLHFSLLLSFILAIENITLSESNGLISSNVVNKQADTFHYR